MLPYCYTPLHSPTGEYMSDGESADGGTCSGGDGGADISDDDNCGDSGWDRSGADDDFSESDEDTHGACEMPPRQFHGKRTKESSRQRRVRRNRAKFEKMLRERRLLGESDIHFTECELREISASYAAGDDEMLARLIETDGGQSCADELKAADRSLFFGLFPRPRSPPPRTDGEAGPSTSGVSGAGDEVIDMDVDDEAEARAGGEAASGGDDASRGEAKRVRPSGVRRGSKGKKAKLGHNQRQDAARHGDTDDGR